MNFIKNRKKEYKNKDKESNEDIKLKKDRIDIARQIILVIVGVTNILFSNILREELPYIIGITGIIISVLALIKNIRKKEYKTLDTMKIPMNVVGIILGIMILLNGENAVPFIAIVMGISGLQKGTKLLNIAIYNKVHNKRFILELLYSISEIILSILLIFNPFEKLEEHLILIGINMVISSLKYFFKDKEYSRIED